MLNNTLHRSLEPLPKKGILHLLYYNLNISIEMCLELLSAHLCWFNTDCFSVGGKSCLKLLLCLAHSQSLKALTIGRLPAQLEKLIEPL